MTIARLTFDAGLFLRRSIRHELKILESQGCTWFETKGFLVSSFCVTGPLQLMEALRDTLIKLNED
jgi:hypothetical protein